MRLVSIIKVTETSVSKTPIAVISTIDEINKVCKRIADTFELHFSNKTAPGSNALTLTYKCIDNDSYMLKAEYIHERVYFLGD